MVNKVSQVTDLMTVTEHSTSNAPPNRTLPTILPWATQAERNNSVQSQKVWFRWKLHFFITLYAMHTRPPHILIVAQPVISACRDTEML